MTEQATDKKECRKRVVITRKPFSASYKRQVKWLGVWWTQEWQWTDGNYRSFDRDVERAEKAGYEIIYK